MGTKQGMKVTISQENGYESESEIREKHKRTTSKVMKTKQTYRKIKKGKKGSTT